MTRVLEAGVVGAATIILVALLASCGSLSLGAPVGPATNPWTVIPSGVVESAGVTLTAQTGAFRLAGPASTEPPEMFKTPFSMMCNTFGRLSPATWRTAADRGAQPVEILVPGRSRPLYGVLALCKAHPSDGSAAARSYRIVVPKSRIAQTSGGRVAFVYELGSVNFPTWILWLSEVPFPVQPKAIKKVVKKTASTPESKTTGGSSTTPGKTSGPPVIKKKAPIKGPCSRLEVCCAEVATSRQHAILKKRFGKIPLGDIGAELEQAKVGAPIVVKRVAASGPAAKSLKPGDVVVSVGDAPVTTLAEAHALIGGAKPGTKLAFGIERGGEWTPAPVVVGKLVIDTVSSCGKANATAAKRNQIMCSSALRSLVSRTRKEGVSLPSSCQGARK